MFMINNALIVVYLKLLIFISLLLKPKKKRDKNRHQMKPIIAATNTAYGTLNVKVSGYDMTLVEHYSQYIHNLCNRLRIKVSEW